MKSREEITLILEEFGGIPHNDADHLAGMIVYGSGLEDQDID